jgi:type I restriction-modification system DNA methylase subunit
MPQMREVLENIYDRIQHRPDLEESEVTDVFTDNDFFETLGYEGIPIDVRSENHIVGGDRPDYLCKDKYGNVVFVVEFKKPSRNEDLASHKRQLWEQYVVPLKAEYGVLTNGEELILYERVGRDRDERKYRERLDDFSDPQLDELENLQKPTYEFETIEEVTEYFARTEPVSVGESVDGEPVGRNEFLDTFRLEQGTLFYEMLQRTYDLIDHYIEQDREDNFPLDAYEFWQNYYASDPGWYDLPEEWREIAGSASNKQKVMFAVETVQSLLGRLMLAKACEDYDFPNVDVSEFVEEETIDFRGEVPPVAYVDTGRQLMSQMREELVESVFEQDIYYWWTQPAEEIEDSSPREIVQQDWPTPVEEFGRSFVEFVIGIARFDFSNVRGDPLGELYQQYFDPKTRRALGEFYTPPDVCDYIVDSAGYGENVQYRRLIDPACGSGTFLVSALDRYKEGLDESDLPNALRDLCNRGRVVGLDIHPFAVVLAQIRFMLEILEEYKRAIEMEPGLVLRRLPIFRTDSLIDESETEEGVQQSISASYDEGTVELTMPLPIRRGSGFESMTFEFPQFNYIQTTTAGEISNQQQYFSALSAVFDAVKNFGEDGTYEIEQSDLTPYFYDYFSRGTNADQISSAFLDTANGFLETVRKLREKYNDGRLLKLIEDVVLGSTLKNDIEYDYVVGNPPWVSKHSRYSDVEQDRRMQQLYLSAWNETDAYLQFMERGLQLLKTGGTLGYIVSNRFLTNRGGKEIRALLAKNRIHELVDFTDYQLFEDATNYSAIITAEKQVANDDWESFIEDDEFTNPHEITAARVRDWNDDIASLVEQLRARESTESVDFFNIDAARFHERVEVRSGRVNTTRVEETFEDTTQQATVTRYLPSVDVWPASPPEEYEILDDIESAMESRLGDRTVIRDNEPENAPNVVGDDIRVGIQTSGDDAYIVKPTVGIDKEKLHELPQLTVRPRGIDSTYTVETDLLKIDITGEDADRWLPNWNNRLVFVPYVQGDDRAELLSPQRLDSQCPRTYEYFSDPEVLAELSDESVERKEVHARLAAEFDIIDTQTSSSAYRETTISAADYRELSSALRENVERVHGLDKDLWWYRYMYRKNIETLPKPKVLTGDLVQYNKLSFDDKGIMAPHNVSVYAIILPEENRHAIAGLLNSALIEFYHKQHSRVHVGKAYRYIEDHTSQWPLVQPTGTAKSDIETHVQDILDLKDLEIKIPQFPDPYIAEARETGKEFVNIEYTASSSYTADPSVQSGLEAGYSIELVDGRVEESIVDTETKAEYVREALAGTRLEANEPVSIPVPLDDAVAENALEEFTEDRETQEGAEISDIESQIDELVFDLFGIGSEHHQEMIRRYNTQYEEIRAIDPNESG